MCMTKLRRGDEKGREGWSEERRKEEREKILRENEKTHYLSPRKSHRKVTHCP